MERGYTAADGMVALVFDQRVGALGFGMTEAGGDRHLFVPHWFLVVSAALLAAVPWVGWKKRFSLMTLLVVMTLVAVGLGTLVVVAR